MYTTKSIGVYKIIPVLFVSMHTNTLLEVFPVLAVDFQKDTECLERSPSNPGKSTTDLLNRWMH